MEAALVGILQAVGLGGLLVIMLAWGLLRTNREVQEKDKIHAEALEFIHKNYQAQLDARDKIITYERSEKQYYRQGMERLLLGVEKLAETVVPNGEE